MKINIFIVLLAFAVLFGCKKDKELLYNSKDNIYFNYATKDTLAYSFAFNPGLGQDTIWVPVIVMGKRTTQDRKFQVAVIPDSTTAVPELDYEPLKPSYTMPADSGTIHIPVIIKNIDTALNSKSVILTIRISGGTDFGSSLGEGIRTKEILFSNRLEEPSWWPDWQGELGEYSRTKHQLFLISSGTVDLIRVSGNPNAYLDIPRCLFYISNFDAFLADPFTWVNQNPDKGYVLTPRNDGTGDYDFYQANSTGKKFHLQYFKQVDKYVFIDENGKQVITN
ncbi:MAG TPA: DUF4843 domain-containing protein [Mucilaginibacter sp.]|nr:DUF4843 domain-containing protein [Mucilaginibacter sp.]